MEIGHTNNVNSYNSVINELNANSETVGGAALSCHFCKLCILFIKKYCIFIISGGKRVYFHAFEDNREINFEN